MPEPSPRARTPLPPLSSIHATVSHDVHVPHGVQSAGPPMLRPGEIDGVLTAARQRAAQARLHPHSVAAPIARPIAAGGVRAGTAPGTSRGRGTRTFVQFTAGTGINPWWRYQEENVPGGGRLMVNIGTGNLLLQDDDMSVPHKGIALAFRRTYNSQSQHDVNGTDGSVPSVYGNGWTSTFDAHLSASPTGTITVWDIDGAHYDYTPAANSTWTSITAGQHATLTSDGGCGLLWTKKSGTTYYFWQPAGGPCAGSSWEAQFGAYDGRLYQIIGRNRNTYITFAYSWDGSITGPGGKFSTIAAIAESGLTATLYFTDVSRHRLLEHIRFPDGASSGPNGGTSVSYGYDTLGNLTSVSRPPNNAAGIRPVQSYGYYGSGGMMAWVASPRWNASDGGAMFYLSYDGAPSSTATLSGVAHVGTVNPAIPDGTGTALQPGYPTGAVEYLHEWFGTGGSTPWYHDTDGHLTYWVFDSAQRPTQTQECTATTGWSCTGTWLMSNETSDSNNNLSKEVDPRGNETDYLYDPVGNTTVVGEPYTATSIGSFKPTKLYDYDAFNNVVAYCDETQTNAAGGDWTGTPTTQSDSLCASQAATIPHWRAIFVKPSYEPYGELASMTTPMGYTHQISYAAAQQAGNDYGLPTAVTGDSFPQLDGSTVAPTQTLWYDAAGNLRCYSKGQGLWVLSYDALGRMTSVADPDDSSANAGSSCGKNSGQPGWNTQATKAYYPDGSTQTSQTPAERTFGVSAASTYDLDGNVVTETQHHGCVPNQPCLEGTTRKWYDGADRLVEVAQPHDTRTYAAPAVSPPQAYDGDAWLTRYAYDLTQGGTVSMTGSAPFAAHGNLFKTQTYLSDSRWTDVRGSKFDALDRETAKYSYNVTLDTHQFETTTLQYDLSPASMGLLSTKTNPSGESVHYEYDALGHVAGETYAGDAGVTPTETYVHDPNGRVFSINSSQFGMQQYAYDDDGRLTKSIEPSGGGVTGAAQISYSYYPNGTRAGVSIASANFTQPNALTYAYRADGLLKTQSVNAFATGSWAKQYTDAGRLSGVSGVDTQTRSYDASGQLSAYGLSTGSTSYTHDPEGSVLTELFSITAPSGTAPYTVSSTINARGELIDHLGTRTRTNSGCLMSMSFPYPPESYDASTDESLNPQNCDRVNGVDLSPNYSAGSADYNGVSYPVGHVNTVGFDLTGRLVHSVSTFYGFAQWDGSGDIPGPIGDQGDPAFGYKPGPTGARALTKRAIVDRTYDVENHLRTLQYTVTRSSANAGQGQTPAPLPSVTPGPPSTIAWGPNGHPISLPGYSNPPGNGGFMTLHWDGDTILFVTDGGGNVVDFKVGIDGDITPRDSTFAGLTVYDRDVAGVIVQASNARGSSGFSPLDPSPVTGQSWLYGPLVQAQYVRSDGFMLAYGIQINGVRAFDANVATWTTPDAYAGDVHDPASQQKYMWNRGNAVEYSDPSGYYASVSVDGDHVLIEISVKFTGDVDDQMKLDIMQHIEDSWSGKFGKYDVTTRIREVKGEPDAFTNTINVHSRDPFLTSKDPSLHGRAGVTGYQNMFISRFASPYTFAHEGGHFMSLGDEYSEETGGTPGFEHNIMSVYGKYGISEDQIRQIIDANAYGYYNSAP